MRLTFGSLSSIEGDETKTPSFEALLLGPSSTYDKGIILFHKPCALTGFSPLGFFSEK
jgi:hypothetical protein